MIIPLLNKQNLLGKAYIAAHARSREHEYYVVRYYGIKFGYVFKSFDTGELVIDAFVSFHSACRYTPSQKYETE